MRCLLVEYSLARRSMSGRHEKSDFIVAINKDKGAPIGEVADVLDVADVMQFVPALTAKLVP